VTITLVVNTEGNNPVTNVQCYLNSKVFIIQP
jgi:hypothetical protein